MVIRTRPNGRRFPCRAGPISPAADRRPELVAVDARAWVGRWNYNQYPHIPIDPDLMIKANVK
jgi:hypothetical protein